MKICIICNEYPEGPHGGIGSLTKLLAEGYAGEGHPVKIIGVYDKSYPSEAFEEKKNLQVYRIKVDARKKVAMILGYRQVARQIKKWISKDEVDIIESPDSYGIFSIFACFRKPFILRANGSNAYFGSILNTPVKWQTRLYEKNLYRKAFRYIAVSKFTADKTSDVLGLSKPFTIIYNGHSIVENMLVNEVPSKVKNYLPNDYIVFSGTLIRKKGIYELVMAVVSLLESGSNLTLVINGKDTKNPGTGVSVRYELEQLIPERFRKFFIFNGHVPREVLIEQYRSARAAVFPSYAEAFAMVPLESMEQGCPTIFSNQTSGNEIIDDGIDGLLINPFDPVNIANAIRRILIEPELGLKLGQKGKEKVLMFSAERMFKESLVFYQECIEQYALKYGKSKQ